MLTVVLSEMQVAELGQRAQEIEDYRVTVNLEECTVTDSQGFSSTFSIDEFQRQCLLEGLDDIGLTLKHEAEISVFESQRPAWIR